MSNSGNRKLQTVGVPKLFNPAVTRESSRFSVPREVNLGSLSSTNFENSSSFRYEDSGVGLKSTQEVPLDWSQFENHTFFNSARSKVNIAFDKIINEYPFDGTRRQVEAFEDSLTGYEKYILDIFPKNTGYLLFSGTQVGETPASGFAEKLGTWIKVIDSAGSQFPDFSTKNTNEVVLDFSTNPFSFEFLFKPNPKSNNYQVLCQKQSGSAKSITLALDSSASKTKVDLLFFITSGSAKLFTSASIEKGKFSHICATYDRDVTGKLQLYVSESLVSTSSTGFEFDTLSFERSPMYIGSGSAFSISRNSDVGGTSYTPVQTLSGALDEFRVFHSQRTIDDQKKYAQKPVYPEKDLKLYFKFNEPSGSFNGESIVLDSSGNSLHSTISNFSTLLRSTGTLETPMGYENISRSPVLFPSFRKVSSLNTKLISSASTYDRMNPNLVTKLVPVHYLLEGQSQEGLSSQEGNIADIITANSIPGSAKMGSVQNLSAFLFIWAKFFDEIKIFIDHFGEILHPDYDNNNTVAGKLLPFVANYYGLELPAIFPNTDPTRYIEGENLGAGYSTSVRSLSYIQNEIWKRILINLNDITMSKGTVHAIKSIIRAAGINPETLMNIREYGGPTKRSLGALRESKTEVASSLDFSGSINISRRTETLDGQGFSEWVPAIVSPFLSSSRLERGYPDPLGTFIEKEKYYPHGISNNKNDGLLTSGSFTYEATYQFIPNTTGSYREKQSLARIHLTGSGVSNTGRNGHGFAISNLVVHSGSMNTLTGSGSTLTLYTLASADASDPLLKLSLAGPDIFDGNLWNISFGRIRSDQRLQTSAKKYFVDPISSDGYSSYFIRCARQANGEIAEMYTTSSHFKESSTLTNNVFQNFWARDSSSKGPYVVIGSQSMAHPASPDANHFLNDVNLDSRTRASSGDRSLAMETVFQGNISQIRFWSKYLEKNEWLEHVKNFKSFGVRDPLVNFNFNTFPTGAFERLRLDVSADQYITASDSTGKIILTDFSQNNLFLTGSGFETTKIIIKPQTFYYSHLSPKFDVAQTDNKVRIRSFEQAENIENSPYAYSAPQYEVIRSEEPDDDTRFSIDFSSVKSLDEDIMNMFGSLDFFNDAMGAPNLIFDDSYPDIDQARKIYFDRLTSKPDYQVFFDMYKWFNSSIGMIIEQFIPRKTKFLGINFVIESHVLERNRFRYLFDEIYLLSLQRDTSRGNLFLSQIAGNLKKF